MDVDAELHPDAQRLLEMSAGRPSMDQVPLADARAGYRKSRIVQSPDAPDVADVRNLPCPGPGGAIAVRLYRAAGTELSERLPALLFFHGGGWVVGDLETHDVTCRQLANAARCAVVAVDYRLAPEHPFPAAVDDAWAALAWLAANASALGIDGEKLAVAGDSAGGNLAAVLALLARERGGPRLALQVLVYPVTDLSLEQPSYVHRGSGYNLTRDSMVWFREAYAPNEADRTDWRAAPLRAEHLRDLPPALVFTAGHDPLCDEGRAYAERLAADGVAVDHRHYAGHMHGFLGSGRILSDSARAIAEIGEGLRAAWR